MRADSRGKLRPGDTIGVVTTSEPVNEEDVNRGVQWLIAQGFEVVLAPHILERNGHLAGSDEARVSDLNAFIRNEKINAVIWAVGGANSARLLPFIDYEAIRKHPKIFLGMSDPTSVLCAIYARTGVVTFHGPVVQYNFGTGLTPFTTKYLWRALRQTEAIGAVSEMGASNILRGGKARGTLIGGNLSSLVQLLGTPFEPKWDGVVLFWEDVCEQPHVLDAKLTHLRNAGVFDRLAGMIVGRLEACEERDYQGVPPIGDIVLGLTDRWRFPVLVDVPLGHTDDKLTLPIGGKAVIDTDGDVLSLGDSVGG